MVSTIVRRDNIVTLDPIDEHDFSTSYGLSHCFPNKNVRYNSFGNQNLRKFSNVYYSNEEGGLP